MWFLKGRMLPPDALSSGGVSRGGGGSVGGGGGEPDGGGVTVTLLGLRGVDGGALVADLGHEAVLVVGGVLGGLDAAVG